jgi:hypothetical protein
LDQVPRKTALCRDAQSGQLREVTPLLAWRHAEGSRRPMLLDGPIGKRVHRIDFDETNKSEV